MRTGRLHAILFGLCLAAGAGCLGAGYLLQGQIVIVPVLLVLVMLWLIAGGARAAWPASSLLLIHVFLAVAGVLLNASIHLMVPGCAAALACWDLIHFKQGPAAAPPPEADGLLEGTHLRSLAAAVLAGPALAFLSSLVKLHLPFGVMAALVLIGAGCLTYGVPYSLKKR